jgi:hypothetical protein
MPIPAVVAGIVAIGVWARKVQKSYKLFKTIEHTWAVYRAGRKWRVVVHEYDEARRIFKVAYDGVQYSVKFTKGGAAHLGGTAEEGLITIMGPTGKVPRGLIAEMKDLVALSESSGFGALYETGMSNSALAKKILTTAVEFIAPW